MAKINRRHAIVGKWYGKNWEDSRFELFPKLEDAKLSLIRRENGNSDISRPLREADRHREDYFLQDWENLDYFAGDNSERYIDMYEAIPCWSPDRMAWAWVIGEPIYRLTLGPRGGVRKESF